MKKQAMKKLVAASLTLGMVAGCFNVSYAEEATGMDAWEPFAETVELEIPVYNRDNSEWATPHDNYWTKYVQENFGDKYNINVTYVPIPRGAVLENYALLAADQDLPTILMEYDLPKQAQWMEDGYLQEIDLDEFAKVAPNYYQRMVDLGQIPYTQLNGETYFCLAERPYYDTNYTFITFYRKDWAKQVGYEEYPDTWAERRDMYQKMIDAGLSEHPLGGQMLNGVGADQNYGFRTYPQDEVVWATTGDYAIPAMGSEANKKFLQRENEKYNLGFLNPEYYLTDLETDKANFVSGKTFEYSGYISSEIDFITGVYENNPDAEIGVIVAKPDAVYDEEGDWYPYAFRADNPFGMIISFAFDATEEEKTAAWMYMEWMTQEENLFTMQWGEEGVNFNYDEKGLPVAIDNAEITSEQKQAYNNNKDIWCVTIEAKKSGEIEDVIRVNTPQNKKDDLTTPIIDNYYARKEIFAQGYGVVDCMFATAIEAVSEYQQTLVNNYISYRDQLVRCAPEEFDALYEELSAKYLDDGFQAVMDERAEALENGMSTKLN